MFLPFLIFMRVWVLVIQDLKCDLPSRSFFGLYKLAALKFCDWSKKFSCYLGGGRGGERVCVCVVSCCVGWEGTTNGIGRSGKKISPSEVEAACPRSEAGSWGKRLFPD